VSVARSFHPDLVLLDFIMPHRDGGEVSRDFKSDPSLSGVPIIMMTASLTARDTGESGFIVRNGQVIVAKPTRTAKLIELIDAQIAAAQG
jgi:CheY-like chemotaxis protein